VGAVVEVVVAPGAGGGLVEVGADGGVVVVGSGAGEVVVGSGAEVELVVVVLGAVVCGVLRFIVACFFPGSPAFGFWEASAAEAENPVWAPLEGTIAKTVTSVTPPTTAEALQARGRGATAVSVQNDFAVAHHPVARRMGSPYLLVAQLSARFGGLRLARTLGSR
jgi:hypothetical protein